MADNVPQAEANSGGGQQQGAGGGGNTPPQYPGPYFLSRTAQVAQGTAATAAWSYPTSVAQPELEPLGANASEQDHVNRERILAERARAVDREAFLLTFLKFANDPGPPPIGLQAQSIGNINHLRSTGIIELLSWNELVNNARSEHRHGAIAQSVDANLLQVIMDNYNG